MYYPCIAVSPFSAVARAVNTENTMTDQECRTICFIIAVTPPSAPSINPLYYWLRAPVITGVTLRRPTKRVGNSIAAFSALGTSECVSPDPTERAVRLGEWST